MIGLSADLHCHTILSDGSVSIDELMDMAQKREIKTLAVTDHDTFAGVAHAVELGKRLGIQVISGMEISTFDYQRKRKAHILCYFYDNPECLKDVLKKIGENRKKAGLEMLRKVLRSYPITSEMVLKRADASTNLYKQHIMHALMDAGYTNSIYGELFQQLFHSKTGSAYASVDYPESRDIIELIHKAGGLAVLAHPAEYDSYDLMEELTQLGLDGVEVWHPRNREGDEVRLLEYTQRHGLIATGGTDFHGMYSSRFHPVGTFTTPDQQVRALLKRKTEKPENQE